MAPRSEGTGEGNGETRAARAIHLSDVDNLSVFPGCKLGKPTQLEERRGGPGGGGEDDDAEAKKKDEERRLQLDPSTDLGDHDQAVDTGRKWRSGVADSDPALSRSAVRGQVGTSSRAAVPWSATHDDRNGEVTLVSSSLDPQSPTRITGSRSPVTTRLSEGLKRFQRSRETPWVQQQARRGEGMTSPPSNMVGFQLATPAVENEVDQQRD